MSNEVAENLREIASNLLAIANRLDGQGGPERGVMVEVARDFMAELGEWSALCQVKIVPDGLGGHTLIGRRIATGFAVGADRDGAVAMRCLLGDGWCSWEYEPEDNELTVEQIAQQATAHVAEKHSPGA